MTMSCGNDAKGERSAATACFGGFNRFNTAPRDEKMLFVESIYV